MRRFGVAFRRVRRRDFILKITPEERAFGFKLLEVQLAVYVVAATLPGDVRVIKVNGPEGVEYTVCDDNLEPICVAGRSLEDLRV